jgi:hypothetical protein
VCKLCLDELGVAVAFCVILGEDIERLFAPIFGDEPTGAFWNKARDVLV